MAGQLHTALNRALSSVAHLPSTNSTDNTCEGKIRQLLEHASNMSAREILVTALRECANPLPAKGQGVEPSLFKHLVDKSGDRCALAGQPFPSAQAQLQ